MTTNDNDNRDKVGYYPLTKSWEKNSFIAHEIFVPLHCQKKDRIWCPRQPVKRGSRTNDNELINHKF